LTRKPPISFGTGSGKPGTATQTPGVEKRKLSVVANIPTAPRLPMADRVGEKRRAAMRTAMAISTVPMPFDTARTLPTEYSQERKGLCETRGWMAPASAAVNLNAPRNRTSATSP